MDILVGWLCFGYVWICVKSRTILNSLSVFWQFLNNLKLRIHINGLHLVWTGFLYDKHNVWDILYICLNVLVCDLSEKDGVQLLIFCSFCLHLQRNTHANSHTSYFPTSCKLLAGACNILSWPISKHFVLGLKVELCQLSGALWINALSTE